MSGIRRDPNTNAIINTDKSAYEQYMIAKKHALNNIELTKKVESMESELSDIRSLLQQLLNK
jgi:hypothetical protein